MGKGQYIHRGSPAPGTSVDSRELGSFCVEFDFDQLFGFVRGRLELPMPYSRHRALSEQRMSAFHLYRFDDAVGQHLSFNLDHAVNIHRPSEGWVHRWRFEQHFSDAVRRILGVGWN